MITGLALFSFCLLVLKFFLERIQLTEQSSNIISMLKLLYVGYFIICLMYTGFIFSVKKTDYTAEVSSCDLNDHNINLGRQEVIIRELKKPIILLISSAILLICIIGNWIVAFITILFTLVILAKMEYNYRRVFGTTKSY
jgi:hypothetical protein